MRTYKRGDTVKLWAYTEAECTCCQGIYHYFGKDGLHAKLTRPIGADRDNTAHALRHMRKELRYTRALRAAVAEAKASYTAETIH